MPSPLVPRRVARPLSLSVLLLAACIGESTAAEPPVVATTPSAPTPPAAASPMGALERPATPEYDATIVATEQAGRYHYLELALGSGEHRWAVVTDAPPPIGASVRAHVFGTREDFESPRLARRFAQLDFATVAPL